MNRAWAFGLHAWLIRDTEGKRHMYASPTSLSSSWHAKEFVFITFSRAVSLWLISSESTSCNIGEVVAESCELSARQI